MQSNGEWVFRNRRCVWAATCACTLSTARVWTSTHGESSVSGAGNSGSWKINSAQIICVHVVPHFDGVEMMMSSSRSSMPSHRALSMIRFRCRRLVSPMGDKLRSGGSGCRLETEQLDGRLAHQVLLHLAGDRHGELVGDVDVARHLEVGDLARAEV